MDIDRTDPTAEVPEADLIEQHTPVDPRGLTGEAEAADAADQPVTSSALADEADLLEQTAQLLGDDDDYPREASDDEK